MALKQPESMDECVYFTRRAIGEGRAMCWVFKADCPECGKAKMGKPRDEKTGDVKIRAKEYVCPECKHSVEKKEYEEGLTANIEYTCPHCQHKGEAQVQFKRKTFQGVPSVVFECESCKKKIGVSKKMKDPKKKK